MAKGRPPALTPEARATALARIAMGDNQDDIAKDLGVSVRTINRLSTGEVASRPKVAAAAALQVQAMAAMDELAPPERRAAERMADLMRPMILAVGRGHLAGAESGAMLNQAAEKKIREAMRMPEGGERNQLLTEAVQLLGAGKMALEGPTKMVAIAQSANAAQTGLVVQDESESKPTIDPKALSPEARKEILKLSIAGGKR